MAKSKKLGKKKRSKAQRANDKRLAALSRARLVPKRTSTKVRTLAKKKGRKNKSSKGTNMLMKVAPMLAPIAYGFVRERASDALANIPALKNLPATQFTDEAVMLGAIWGARKLGLAKNSAANSFLRAAKVIELARIGETLADMRGAKATAATGVVQSAF